MKKEDVKFIAGLSSPVLLFMLFLVLRLTGVIDWSWWWITAPVWIPIAATLLICACVYLYLDRKGDPYRNDTLPPPR